MSLRKRRGLVIANELEKIRTGIGDYDENRYIRAQGKVPRRNEIIQAIKFIPTVTSEDRLLSAEERKQKLNYISYFHSPRIIDVKTVEKVMSMQNEGYMCRDERIIEDIDSEEYRYSNQFIPRGLGIFGTSGCGKTTIISKIQELYYEGIIHSGRKDEYVEDYCLQIPMVKVNIPSNCTTKTVCMRILMEIDKVADKLEEFSREKTHNKKLNYKNKHYFPNIESLLNHVEATIKTNHIGILVLDEIHNIRGAKAADRTKLLNFFVELSNEVQVPLVFIGTEDAISLFNQEFQNGRRLCTECPILYSPFSFNAEWEIFLKNLFKLQWIKTPLDFSEQVSAFFYEMSHGIPDVIIKVFKGAQENAIDNEIEKLTIEDFIYEYQKRCILIDGHLADMDEYFVSYRLKNMQVKNRKERKEVKCNKAILEENKEEQLALILEQLNFTKEESKKISRNVVLHLGSDASLEKMLNIVLGGYREDRQILEDNTEKDKQSNKKTTGILKVYMDMDKKDRKDKKRIYEELKANGYIAERNEFI